MLWLSFLYPIHVVSISVPAAKSSLRSASILEHEANTKLITDEVAPAAAAVKVHKHDHLYENVGKGNCINTSSVVIEAKPSFSKTKIEMNGEADECARFCTTNAEQCAGYISLVQKGECAVILAGNPNYKGGIYKADDAEGIICFKRSGIPIMRQQTNGWETFGAEEKTKDPDHPADDASGGSYDPFQTTTTTPPPTPNNMAAKIIFCIIVIGAALIGFWIYGSLYV